MSSIIFDNVTKSYSENTAVDQLSFSVEKGKIFGLLGPNGSGKTTTVNLVTALLIPDKGRISVLDKDPRIHWKEIRQGIGLVPQETTLYPDLNAVQNLKFFAALYMEKIKNVKNRIDEILELVELKPRSRDKIKTYSGGMKRRLAIGRALLHNPDILLMDEPTLGVDVQGSHRIWDYIRKLSKSGKTILVTTNVMSEADYLCDSLLIIDHGKKIAAGTVNELKATVKVEKKPVVHQATLDDVFLHYTGRSLRD